METQAPYEVALSAPVAPGIPHSHESEEAVIGAVLINPEVYYDVAQFLQSDDFYIHRLRWIWDAFTRLHESRTPLDLLTASEELSRMDQLAEIGGPAYLTSLVNQVPTSLHAEAYGRVVEAHSLRRKLLNAANSVATMAYNEQIESIDLAGQAAQAIEEAIKRSTNGTIENVSSVASRVYDLTDKNSRLEEDEKDLGLMTGYPDLDKLLRGIDKKNLVIVGGRPSMGKSAFLQNIMRNVAVGQGKNVAFFSMEASNEEVTRRLISQISLVDGQDIKEGTLSDGEWPKFTNAVEQVSNANIFMDDTAALSPIQLRTKCKRLKMVHGLDLIIVDYLQLMRVSGMGGLYETTTYVARSLKDLAQEIDVPVLAAAQLSRKLEDRKNKRPMLSDLKDSGEIEQAANIVIFPYRADYYDDEVPTQNITEIIVAKHRDGPLGTVELLMRPQCTKFESVETRRIDFTTNN